ncbi:MAG: SPOR domain-containing protein [Paracoccus sp. (in: a-proteobacteria)]|nr:SPOR domain-containing protein [Paracoccus sp. (in: a-proteobacteria)]
MAVTDFGAGRFDDSRPSGRAARQYTYQHQVYDDYDEDAWYEQDQGEVLPPPDGIGARLARVTHYMGALVSVLLILGLVVWGYKLIVRDVSGVPVIRAMEGDARITPDDPGGVVAARSGGLAVSQVAGGTVSAPQAQVAIAPAPTGLDESDVAMAELGYDPAALVPIDPAQSQLARLEPTTDFALTEEELAMLAEADQMALSDAGMSTADADALAQAVAEMAAATGAAVMGDEAEAAPEANPLLAQASVKVSAPPARRPQSVTARATQAPAAAPAEARTAEAAPAAEAEPAPEPAPEPVQVAANGPLVQIGAFDSNAIANSEWGRISGRFSSLFSGKSQVIQTTERNGRTFYRLRVAGFASRDDARRFCAALIAEGTDCIPATQ